MIHSDMESPVGTLHLFAGEGGLTGLYMNVQRYEMPQSEPGTSEVIDQAKQELREYFSGTRREFTVPLDPQGTEFRKSV